MYLFLCVHAVIVTSYVEIPPQKIPYGSLFFLYSLGKFPEARVLRHGPHPFLGSQVRHRVDSIVRDKHYAKELT